MTELARTPDMIAGEINTIKEQVRGMAVQASVEIGRRLQEAKRMVPEGQWLAWLENAVSYSARTAQNLMALAAEYDSGNGKALEGMSYSKAVLLLSVPRYDREEFVQDHDVEHMSTRELKDTIAQLQDQLAGQQITMDEAVAAADNEEKQKLQDELDAVKKELKELQHTRDGWKKQDDALRAQLVKAQSQQSDAEKKALKEAKDARMRADTLQQVADGLVKEKEALQQALKAAQDTSPMIQQVTPPEVEAELSRLREQVARTGEETALRAEWDLLRRDYERLRERLDELAIRDGEKAGKYRDAFAKGLRVMSSGIGGMEA